MILKKEDRKQGKIEIDLTGPDGNAYVLMGYANRWATDMGYSKEKKDAIIADMTSSDYEHLLEVIDKHFGKYVTFWR
jgi:hypothetical protein